ncbi:hypothetical protein PMAYCL1PPCAC_19235 [Pristionchus mayeri]|uniref:Glutathione S-transferase kappa n=1 Tax=Pristionchus mayeri TaxID=1317129 RepID=A0AAN5CR51_9BILA|nr:hypothetical protein PMAYCL1PPCAC_19235 [Pristionchus mayeri]
MASSKSLIKYFFDINSPYSYIGFELLARLQSRHSSALAVQWSPVRIPAIFRNIHAKYKSPFIQIPEKTLHMERDLRHQCEYYGIEMRVPEGNTSAFLKAGNTVAAQRLIVAAGEEEVSQSPLIHAFYTRMWRDHLPMHEDAHLHEVLASLGIDQSTASSLIAKSKSPEVKQHFVDYTQEAIDDGAFGIPWMKVYRANEVNHESFFGSDRFHLIERHLGL